MIHILAIEYDENVLETQFSSLPYQGSDNASYVILDNMVLDVTDYLVSATNIVKVAKGSYSRAFALDRMFLPLDLTILLFTKTGTDISSEVSKMNNAQIYKECMIELFHHGVVDIFDGQEGCNRINVGLWITMGIFLLYFLLKMNLANSTRIGWIQRLLFKSQPNIQHNSPRYLPPYTLMFIPCYAESSETIRQTFDSLARNNYPDTRKLLFFVCDGLTQSNSDSKETYLCILESLGYGSTKDPEIRSYISLGQGARRINYAKVYAGFYESGRNRVPFLMIVKVGSPLENMVAKEDGSRAPGNRGKRDSMLIVLGFLERCMNLSHNRISPLEFELFNQCYNLLNIDPRWLKYMLVTDADVQVQDDVLTRLVSRLESDSKLLAMNGHIRPANPEENIITMLQILPNYMTFYSSLAYEACLGGLTTINGGFVMYRLWSESHSRSNSRHYEHNKILEPGSLSTHLNKWPKVSDEIIVSEDQSTTKKSASIVVVDDDDDDTSSDDNFTATNTTVSSQNKTTNSSRRRMFTKTKKLSPARQQQQQHLQQQQQQLPQKLQHRDSSVQHVALTPSNKNIKPICIQPTVLRGFGAPRPNTMHMENVLLLGEEQYFSIVLLRSHLQHKIGFEPEAIAYATIPTNFFALQALQIRNIRSTFHNQVEFQHVAKHLGFMYWIMSLTKLLDTILLTPMIVYLYGVFIRALKENYPVYNFIAFSFTGLVILHVVYFIIRRQFKYVLWFFLYAAFGVLLFNVYFPILAIWCSDNADRWYDVWPTKQHGLHSRLHGLLQSPSELALTTTDPQEEEEQEEEIEDSVPRMRLSDFEVIEAERLAQREKEQVEMLDAKFNGFTSYVGSHASKPSWSSTSAVPAATAAILSPPPVANKLKGTHSRLASEDDARFLLTPNRSSTPRSLSINSGTSASPRDPFTSALDNPFDDAYSDLMIMPALQKPAHHKQSHSQSSNFSRSSNSEFPYYPHDMFAPAASSSEKDSFHTPTRMRSFSASNRPHLVYSKPTTETIFNDSSSVISLTNSVISLERDAPYNNNNDIEPPQFTGRRRFQQASYGEQDEGRSAPVHSRIVSQYQS